MRFNSALLLEGESRLQRWLTRNHSKYTDASVLKRRHIFIIPTRAGLCLGGVLFIMLLTSLNYMNSMSMLFTFFIAGIGFNSAWFTHLNLCDLELHRAEQNNLFVGQKGHFKVIAKNQTKRDRFGLVFRERNDNLILHDITANSEITIKMPITPSRRGEYKLRRFAVATRMPVGLFNAWSWQTLNTSLFAYPQPIANYPPPVMPQGDSGEQLTTKEPGEEFSNLRDYVPGDSVKHIAWKQQARHNKLLTKEYSESSGGSMTFSWDYFREEDAETRLSFLCFWLLEAEKQNIPCALELPNQSMASGSGKLHIQKCLLALAKFAP